MKRIRVLTFGGTISQSSDSSGRATPGFDVRQLASSSSDLPVSLQFQEISSRPSKDVTPRDWTAAVRALTASPASPWDGTVILHGTDTLHYTAAALSFLLGADPAPVVLTGSMRPGGDVDSDARPNFRAAVIAAADSRLRGVSIVFSADPALARAWILSGLNSRKVHTTAPNAFSPYESAPRGYIEDDCVHLTADSTVRRDSTHSAFPGDLTARVPIVKHSPGLSPDMLAGLLSSADGVVVEGTGVGHVSDSLLQVLTAFEGPVVMSTQVATGGEHLGTYAGDQRLLGMPNVMRSRSMASETAQAKLIWALTAFPDDVRAVMESNICGEFEA